MTPRLLHDLMSVLQALHEGRAHAAAEALADLIREHGGTVPADGAEAPMKKPIWMERGA